MKEMLENKDIYNDWCFNFRRNLMAWEDEGLENMKVDLGSGPTLYLEFLDSIIWKADQSRCFRVKFMFNWCEMNHGSVKSLGGFIWNNAATLKS